jgi:hypothetical protein
MDNPDITSKGDTSPEIIEPEKSRNVGKKLYEFFANIAAHINRQDRSTEYSVSSPAPLREMMTGVSSSLYPSSISLVMVL